jgi:hypothetical protein
MEPSADRVRSNLREVRDRIDAAAAKSGRAAGAVHLVAVTKTVSEEVIRLLVQAGQRDLGENRAQQLRDRAAALAGLDIAWHMIGRLQRKNVKYVVPAAAMIHSVDSLEVAGEISRRATAGPAGARLAVAGQTGARLAVAGQAGARLAVAGTATGTAGQAEPSQDSPWRTGLATPARTRAVCLLEVNSGEAQKAGVAPAQAPALAAAVAALPGVDLMGLMTMAPLVEDPETVRPVFAGLRELLARINREAALPRPLAELSMGMTQDYQVAVEEGATMVRVGTALFL